MDFGLGLILSFTDNATAGINNAINSLERFTDVAENVGSSLNSLASFSSLSFVAGQLGDSFMKAGANIISTFGNIISKVNQTGTTMMFAESQLNKLYEGSAMSGTQMLDKMQDYAKKSIFNFEDLIPVVISLKSVGIEAFDNIATSTGNANQTLMDYASDLASFAPQMRNAYGTGIQASMGALREYIAEGNAMSLKRGASLDILGILGEEKGKTIEARSQQVADLIEKLNMVGMTANLANTPMQRLGNMQDVLFQTLTKISNSGVYDKINSIIERLSDYVFAISDTELDTVAELIGSTLTSIMKPLDWATDKIIAFADGIRRLVNENPKLIKFLTVLTASSGVLLLVVGVILKATSALSGLALILITSGNSFKNLGSIFKAGSLKILGVLIPLMIALSLMRMAWNSDFASIRTNTMYYLKGITESFKTASKLLDGDLASFTKGLEELRDKGDFFSNLTIGIMKVKLVIEALAEAWNTFTLSEDTYNKANELGILPLIESILQLKYHFGLFKQGFIDGWKEIGENVKESISGFLDSVEGTALESLVDNLTTLMEKLSSGDSQSWYDFGKSFAEFSADALVFVAVMKGIGFVLGTIAKVGGAIKGIGTIGTVFGKLGGLLAKLFPVITQIGTAIGGVITAIAGIVGLPAWLVGIIIAAIVGVIVLIVKFRKQIAEFFGGIVEDIKGFFGGIAEWFSTTVFQPIATFFMTYIYPFIEKIAEIVGKIIEIVSVLFSVFVGWLDSNVIQPIIEFFSGIWDGIVSTFSNIANWFGEEFRKAYDLIMKEISPIVEFFSGVWNDIVSIFSLIGSTIAGAISDAVTSAINWVLNYAGNKINGFIKAINKAIDFINAIPGVEITKLTLMDIPQLAKGGVVDSPTMSIIGEAGKEAVVPLENNLGWISSLASMITDRMSNIRPTSNPSVTTNNNQGNNDRYMTSNVNNNSNVQGDTDNSIVISEGAIQLTVQNASEEEAIRMAKTILEYIKRQKELDRMLQYA